MFWPGDPQMLTFCSAYEVPKGDTCRGDIDKAGQSKSVLLSAVLVLRSKAEPHWNLHWAGRGDSSFALD